MRDRPIVMKETAGAHGVVHLFWEFITSPPFHAPRPQERETERGP